MFPRPIYELMPFVYLLLGVLTLAGIDPMFERLAGVLLLTAGLLICYRRLTYRSWLRECGKVRTVWLNSL